MSDRIRVYVKKELRLDLLNFDQNTMFRLGTVAVGNVVDRVKRAINANDQKAKPLSKSYVRRKSGGQGRRAVRDLTLTGRMLENFSVRTVSENRVSAANTTRLDQTKARVNNKIETWVAFSASNTVNILNSANKLFTERLPKIVKQK